MTQAGRILILGSAGQVGRELQRSLAGAGEVLARDRRDCDLADAGQLRRVLRDTAPDLIVNAAAYTAVDRAESEKELATAVNAVAPGIIAEEAHRRDVLLVHYSTDYVFDGAKKEPWVETDEPDPLNHYGASKLAGERAIAQAAGKYLILRTSWVYGPHGKNFLLRMLQLGRERDRLSVVDDQTGSPTTARAIAEATRLIVDALAAENFGSVEDWAGVYHMTCGGATTWRGFAQEIFERAEQRLGQRRPELLPITSDQWPTPAKRPRNSVLSNDKLRKRFGLQLPDWKMEIERTIEGLVCSE